MAEALAFPSEEQKGSEIIPLREHCGVIGVWVAGTTAPYYATPGLMALQHRGLESAGLTASDHGQLQTVSGMGRVVDVLNNTALADLGKSEAAIAHTRYATTGKSTSKNAQPITMRSGEFAISLAHNGNLINADELKAALHTPIEATSDTALQTALLAQERYRYPSWVETLKAELPRAKGAFSSVAVTESGELFGFKDERDIRPLCIGRLKNGGWVIASETVALDAIGAEYMREVLPGEIVHISPDGRLSSEFFGVARQRARCALELIYFARPDSWKDGTPGIRLREGRIESGRRLAKRMQEKGVEIEAVVPVLNSGGPAAEGVAQVYDVSTTHAISTNPNATRTFILPTQQLREDGVNGKHNVIPEGIEGSRITLIDDSMVRSTTLRGLIGKAMDMDPLSLAVGLASPPVVDVCDLGVDMPTKGELAASPLANRQLSQIEEAMAGLIGVDSLTYSTIGDIAASFKTTPSELCFHCFGGDHPVRGEQRTFRQKEKPMHGKPKMAIFISGEGTNMEEIARQVLIGELDADIVSIVTNNPHAAGIEKARALGLPVEVISSQGRIKNAPGRVQYEQELAEHLEAVQADMVVLAGWNLVMGDALLTRLQRNEVPVINLHPALLPGTSEDIVQTSRGKIPTLRGLGAIDQAYRQNLRVSGVTVYQVLPGRGYDVGPILLREEVRGRKVSSLEEWQHIIHATEHRVLPTALKRAIHIMKQGIDISQGDFPW